MNRIEGLEKLIRSTEYRDALGLSDEVNEEYRVLAQGEYNINYAFTHPVSGRRLILRVNCGSQMHLDDQIEYEYRALKMLHKCGRTPEALYVDGSMKYLPHGVLVMEELPGHHMDYDTELMLAAGILADIHSCSVPSSLIPEKGEERSGNSLISPEDPIKAILDECEQMVAVYMGSPLSEGKTRSKLRKMLDKGWSIAESMTSQGAVYRCCINTELNSTNFLINGGGKRNYLVDWEKPLYGDPAQDLGHLLAPTTTFWKTDVILSKERMSEFIDRYQDEVSGRFDTAGLRERTVNFTTITCLRGVTWCAMAWVEYRDPGRALINESTRKKLDQYMDPGFLDYIDSLLEK